MQRNADCTYLGCVYATADMVGLPRCGEATCLPSYINVDKPEIPDEKYNLITKVGMEILKQE